VLIGEFGTKLETRSDQQWLDQMVGYLRANGMSFGYWSFNPNSADTGGLVGDDWKTAQTAKLTALAPILGTSATPAPTPSPTATASSTPTASPQPSANAGATWQLQSSWGQGYVAQITVEPRTSARSSWAVSWSDPSAVSVASAWGMACSVAAKQVTCRGTEWGQSIPAGASLTVGLHMNAAGPAPTNPVLTVW
jgi:endoglucanase